MAITFSSLKVGQWFRLIHPNIKKEIQGPWRVVNTDAEVIALMNSMGQFLPFCKNHFMLLNLKIPADTKITVIAETHLHNYKKLEKIASQAKLIFKAERQLTEIPCNVLVGMQSGQRIYPLYQSLVKIGPTPNTFCIAPENICYLEREKKKSEEVVKT